MSAALANYNEEFKKALHREGKLNDFFKIAEDKTKIQRVYIAYAVVGVLVLWLMFGYGGQLLCNTLGFAYPAYCSIRALESYSKKDDTQWLTYWVVFALFSVLEYFSDILVGWVPFYWLSKMMFMVWCMAPIEANGATVIYNRVVLPLFNKHQGTIDNAINKATEGASGFLDQAIEKAKDVAAEQQLDKKDE